MLIDTDQDNLHKIVVLNAKGGSGKTTLATNIAAYYAMRGPAPTLVDCDPQGFSMRWLDKRPNTRPRIDGVDACQQTVRQDGIVHIKTRPKTENIIIDLAAGTNPDELLDATYDAGSILIPVMPSDIDVYCASRFIAELLLIAQIDRGTSRMAVVANRTRQNTRSLAMLMRFLTSLNIPIISVLRDSQNFVHAAADGIGIHELPSYKTRKDIAQMDLIMNWLDRRSMHQAEVEAEADELAASVQRIAAPLPLIRPIPSLLKS